MHDVTAGQLALLFVSIALFAIGTAASLARLWWERDDLPQRGAAGRGKAYPGNPLRVASKACLYLGVVAGLGTLVWHAAERGRWVPLEDNFDALIWLGLLLALFVLYTQRAHPLRGLDWFVIPVVVVLLVSAAVFGKTNPHEYTKSAWSWVHRVTAYGGAVAFAVAFAVGCMYLIVNRRLRAKPPTPGPNMGSLERLERITLVSVTLGFSLLTVGMVTGIVRWFDANTAPPMTKVVLASIVWVVYAAVMHSPINPSFRGRKAAVLSVVGFVLMVGTIVAVQLMPGN